MNFRQLAILCLVIGFFSGCTDAWEDHTATNKDVLLQNLNQYLQNSADHSVFARLVKEVGLEAELASSMQYTLVAPTNTAMQAVPAAQLVNEDAKRLFVKHHITYGRLLIGAGASIDRIKMLNEKVLEHKPSEKSLGGVSVTAMASTLVNGYFYSAGQAIIPLPSIWDYLENMAPDNKHVRYFNSLTKLVLDEELSTQIGVDEFGQPLYDPVFVYRNAFNDEVVNLASEDSTLTLFIIEDTGFDVEFNKFRLYYRWVNGLTARDTAETRLQISRDYVFTEAYSPGEVPASIVSPFGVRMDFNEASVVSHFKASNGYVYVLSACPVAVEERIKTIYLEGENPENYYGLISEKGVPAGYLRKRSFASEGKDFVLDNHVSGTGDRLTDGLFLGAGYLPSTRYRVYWRAINDFRTSYRFPSDNELRQRLGTAIPMNRSVVTGRVTRFAPPTVFSEYRDPETNELLSAFIPVTATAYSEDPLADEVFIGTVNFGSIREVFLQLQPEGEDTRNMAVTLDYIKLVPVFN